MATKTEGTPKVANPAAPRTGNLPDAPAGCEWDTIEVAGWDFAIMVAKDMSGITRLTGGDETLAARMFNRALRIDAPAKLDGRKLMAESKDAKKTAEYLQTLLLAFDPTTIRPRAARTPKAITVPDQKTFSQAEVRALLAANNIIAK